jgi:hypothetical protein
VLDGVATLSQAIEEAESLLPGVAAEDGRTDPRWQAIIQVSEFIPDDPRGVWVFAKKWGRSDDRDLRAAVATCLVEHLLKAHFDAFFPEVAQLARLDRRFAACVTICWLGGDADPEEARQFNDLLEDLRSAV